MLATRTLFLKNKTTIYHLDVNDATALSNTDVSELFPVPNPWRTPTISSGCFSRNGLWNLKWMKTTRVVEFLFSC